MLLASGFVEVRMHLKGTFTPFCFFFVTLVKFQLLKVQLTNNVWCLSPSLWAKWALTAREGYGVCRNAHSSSSFWYKEIFVRVFFIKPEFEPASTSFRSFAESPFRSKKREKKQSIWIRIIIGRQQKTRQYHAKLQNIRACPYMGNLFPILSAPFFRCLREADFFDSNVTINRL